MANHPEPQTKEQLVNDVLHSIRGVCLDMIAAIDREDAPALEVHHDFLETQWRRRKTILTTPQQKRR